ncbi:MAG TPA: glycogen/starch/alpha-glucan phosphorylase [Negativicutes bacterium]|nr:glycogen/starch/alpha-glucan phosphorylase [Negativicutes bacterium]
MMNISKEKFKEDYLKKLTTMYAKSFELANNIDKYSALGSLIRDYASEYWMKTNKEYAEKNVKQVYYFSIEFLLGTLLGNNLVNLGLEQVCEEVLEELGCTLKELKAAEPDAGLGNGGLGRLAACFLDSMASLGIPGHGCGIRYKYGLFQQKIVDGYQVELPENWLREGNVWEMRKADKAVEVKFGGNIITENDGERLKFRHENYQSVLAVPYDTPIIGYSNETVNTLRLWSAENPEKDFDLTSFSKGDYMKAVEHKYSVEAISQVLYPDDSYAEGRRLRLKQQYFFVSAGLQSIVRTYKRSNASILDFDEKVAIHINDTHPALAVPELMRILMDEEGLDWYTAWKITTNTISYTNHTILSEALEKWPIDMFREMLPRIYMIVEEINGRFCSDLWNRYIGQWDKIARMAITADGYVKMAHLAIVGSHSVNGVAKLHTEILKKQELSDFYHFYPYKFNNKTNGITHRRWLLKSNPELAQLLRDTIGDDWTKHPTDLIKFLKYQDDPTVQEKARSIKYNNKVELGRLIKQKYSIDVDPASIFDVQIKRLHAYKRQLLNVLHIMHLYNLLREDPQLDIIPRTFIFGAKAAPGYYLAKQEIKLINTLADKVNKDKTIKDKLKVVFMEDYRVSLAEKIIPAADISEQISTTTKEASGTGNMKLMMNGAITVATLDGANIEIRDEVGDENIVIFGMTEKEVLDYYRQGDYKALDFYNDDPRIKKVVDQLVNGFFPVSNIEFLNIYNHLLLYNDEYFVLKDFASYIKAHQHVDELYRQEARWQKMSINNIAHSGVFSSDRTISEYASGIWDVKRVIL